MLKNFNLYKWGCDTYKDQTIFLIKYNRLSTEHINFFIRQIEIDLIICDDKK